jgi:hypothetical protein
MCVRLGQRDGTRARPSGLAKSCPLRGERKGYQSSPLPADPGIVTVGSMKAAS